MGNISYLKNGTNIKHLGGFTMKSEVMFVPDDKCTLELWFELESKLKSSIVFVHNSFLEKLRKAPNVQYSFGRWYMRFKKDDGPCLLTSKPTSQKWNLVQEFYGYPRSLRFHTFYEASTAITLIRADTPNESSTISTDSLAVPANKHLFNILSRFGHQNKSSWIFLESDMVYKLQQDENISYKNAFECSHLAYTFFCKKGSLVVEQISKNWFLVDELLANNYYSDRYQVQEPSAFIFLTANS